MTGRAQTLRVQTTDFNPHSREGSDGVLYMFSPRQKYFNPHSREGSDQELSDLSPTLVNFNPHSREGSDGDDMTTDNGMQISIHTPARGVTTD